MPIEITGMKRRCSGGGWSDGYLVYCRFSDEPGANGIGTVYVDHGAPGLSYGARQMLMGFRGIYSADIFFDNLRIPAENILVGAGGLSTLMEAFGLGPTERIFEVTDCEPWLSTE